MTKFVIICLGLLLITLVTSTSFRYSMQQQSEYQQPSEHQRQEQLITYVDPYGNYTLQYPQSWKVEYKKPTTLYR